MTSVAMAVMMFCGTANMEMSKTEYCRAITWSCIDRVRAKNKSEYDRIYCSKDHKNCFYPVYPDKPIDISISPEPTEREYERCFR